MCGQQTLSPSTVTLNHPSVRSHGHTYLQADADGQPTGHRETAVGFTGSLEVWRSKKKEEPGGEVCKQRWKESMMERMEEINEQYK